jgi:hypothetical protein
LQQKTLVFFGCYLRQDISKRLKADARIFAQNQDLPVRAQVPVHAYFLAKGSLSLPGVVVWKNKPVPNAATTLSKTT